MKYIAFIVCIFMELAIGLSLFESFLDKKLFKFVSLSSTAEEIVIILLFVAIPIAMFSLGKNLNKEDKTIDQEGVIDNKFRFSKGFKFFILFLTFIFFFSSITFSTGGATKDSQHVVDIISFILFISSIYWFIKK